MSSAGPGRRLLLAVSDGRAYQHQADALVQLAGDNAFERIPLSDVANELIDPSLGPFLVAIDDDAPLPLVGVPGIVEALHRADPNLGLLPSEPLRRAHVRGLAAKIEELFSRLAVADIASHREFGRRIWLEGSDAPERMMDDLPMRLSILDRFLEEFGTPYIGGDRAGMADCLLAAAWWVAEDLAVADQMMALPVLAAWHGRACHGAPFQRTMTAR